MIGRDRWERIRVMIRKEFLQIFREPRLRRILFVAPLIQLVVFGYAVSTDIRDTATFVIDHDKTRASRDLIDTLTASSYFRVVGRSDHPPDLTDALDHGKALLGVEIPVGFEADTGKAGGAPVQLVIDGTHSTMATTAKGYAERIVLDYAARLDPGSPPNAVDLRERIWYNPDLISRNYNVPAVVGTIIFLVSLLLTSLAVVREREIGTLEQLMVSPLTRGELIAGKVLPFAAIALIDLILITLAALYWFEVPFRGNILVLLSAGILYLFSGLGLGLLISTLSKTQQEAFLSTFLVTMPTILLSGFMFPIQSMPVFFQWITLLNPMRHFLEIVRGVFLKGTGFEILWPQFLALLLIGSAVLWLAASRFQKRV